jgi:2-dehydropantoate 2-reductase
MGGCVSLEKRYNAVRGQIMHAPLNIIVIGAGAIGGWLGGRLALHGHRVTLLGRPPLARAVHSRGLQILWPEPGQDRRQQATLTGIDVATSLAEAGSGGPFDLALFTVKTYDTAATIEQMQAADLGQPAILSFQNGVRSEQALSNAFGAGRIIAGTLLNPISTLEPGTLLLEKWQGGIGLAAVDPDGDLEPWAAAFRAVLRTRIYRDYQAMKWSKLVLNLIGNASAAILDMSTVDVFADPRLFHLEVEMLREAVAVMRHSGLKPVGLPGYPVPLLARGLRWAPNFLLAPIMRKLVSGGRGDKPPSLLLELRRGRNRSEISDLNGAVVRAGNEAGVPTPVNHALTEIMSRLVKGRVSWDSIRHQPGVLLAVVEGMRR